ncbi:hypothetical protein EYF80_036824 [Liparis tanakae]|uniref:Uncharacterized protein n=1 Tax=Liparis tanakae TaxID=230148 RepID=A0A4Z2GHV9_9TELE|nr:hypothetical protein EYF80_036824 [Liparis tanakae]
MVHLIMRPHTEPRLDADLHCLGQPASNPGSRSPPPRTDPSPQPAEDRRKEGARYEAADPPAPAGLLNR